jgi:hypothetical protein
MLTFSNKMKKMDNIEKSLVQLRLVLMGVLDEVPKGVKPVKSKTEQNKKNGK